MAMNPHKSHLKIRASDRSDGRRDDYRCPYCAFHGFKWQTVHHIDGDPENNNPRNLATVCPMCNLILHAGMGCVLLRVADLYRKSKCSRVEVVRRTRSLRAAGYNDTEIRKELGLREKVPFKTDRKYLQPLVAFTTSRKAFRPDWHTVALEYGYTQARVNRHSGQSQR